MLSSALYIVLTVGKLDIHEKQLSQRKTTTAVLTTTMIIDPMISQSGNVNWWSNELDSLGIKKISSDGGNKKDNR